MRSVAVLLALAGCYHPAYEDCAVSCAQSGVCPSGLECKLGVCRSQSGACGGGSDVDAASVDGWRFRKTVTFLPSSTVTFFPALVRRAQDTDLANFAQSGGEDIRFTATDGSPLPHEIERFVKATGELVAWVQIPRLVAGQPFDAYLYYGNDAAADQQTPAAVWDADFEGVWHLADPPGSAIAESTSAGRDGTKGMANTPAANDVGLIAGAQNFTGTVTDYFALANSTGLDTATMTFEAWMRVGVPTSGGGQHILYAVPSAFTQRIGIGYLDLAASPVGTRFVMSTPTAPGGLQTEAGSLATNAWHHFMAVFGTTTAVSVYVDGVLIAPPTVAQSPLPPSASVAIGGAQNVNLPGLFGMMDEVRLSSTQRTPEYVKQSVAFVTDPSLVTFSAADSLPL